MKKRFVVYALTILVVMLAMPPAGADLDTGMEGLWTGSSADGQMTLLLGSQGTFISLYQADQTYRQAGVFSVDQDNMYLTMTDGSTATLQYGFSEGSLYISGDGDEIELKRIDFSFQDNFTGVWVLKDADGTSGLIAMDGNGGFASVDTGSGETQKGIYLPDQGELLVALQDCTSLRMNYDLDAEQGTLSLTNADSGESMHLTRYAPPETE